MSYSRRVAGLALTGVVLVCVGSGLFLAFRSAPRVPAPKVTSEAEAFWTTAAETPTEIVGAGYILFAVSASWPLAVLQYGAAGVGLRIRWFSEYSCAFTWSEIIGIERTRRTILVRALQSRTFRFLVMAGGDLDPVLREAEAHGVTIEWVGSTYRSMFRSP